MDEANNYSVIGLDNYNAMRDELAVLRYENEQLRADNDALRLTNEDIAAKHAEVQEFIQKEVDNEDGQVA